MIWSLTAVLQLVSQPVLALPYPDMDRLLDHFVKSLGSPQTVCIILRTWP